MTHDELLARIKDLDGLLIFSDGRPPLENVGVGDRVNLALRAVVELHKPDKFGEECTECLTTSSYDAYPVDYPCPTIRAIEKELG